MEPALTAPITGRNGQQQAIKSDRIHKMVANVTTSSPYKVPMRLMSETTRLPRNSYTNPILLRGLKVVSDSHGVTEWIKKTNLPEGQPQLPVWS